MTADRDKKTPLPLHIPKCIERVLSSSHVPLPVVSGLSCIAARAGRACIGCQRRPPRPGRQKVTPALRRLLRLCPSFVPPVRAATNSPLVTRLICIASAGQWVAQFLHLGRPRPCRGPSAAPWLPVVAIKNFDQFPPECGRVGAGRDAAPGSSLTLHTGDSHTWIRYK